jgi:hypothetical protein
MSRTTYNFIKEPQNQDYYDLLGYSVIDCKYLLLVVRNSIQIDSEGKNILLKLIPFLCNVSQKNEWPGTTLSKSNATIYKYYLNPECIAIIRKFANRLYQWQQPTYPEDLCLLRDDDTPWLVSIAHESDGFLLLSKDEATRLFISLPKLQAIIKRG